MIERTQDYRRPRKIADQNPMSPDDPWQLIISREVFYLMEVKDGRDLGVWAFEPHEDDDGDTIENEFLMHTSMGPDCRGKAAIDSGLQAIKWMYANTSADVILAPVPVELKHAQRIPRQAGLTYMGDIEGVKYYRTTREEFRQNKRAF